MPVLDMPLGELRKYYGTNPKPEDFDAYWDAALAEMRSIDAKPEFVPADFKPEGAECYDLYFTGVNGARIHAKHLRPKNINGKIPAVLLFHGYSASAGAWWDKLAYVLQGAAVFALDVRGQAGESEDTGGTKGTTWDGHFVRGLADENPQKLLFRHIFLDTAQLAGIALDMDLVDESRVYAHGGSQGGALTLACAALEPRIARIAPMYPFLSDYKRVWEMDLDVDAYRELKYYFRKFDPAHEREDEIFTRLGYIDVHNLAPRIKAQTLFFTGLLDNICPPSTQFAAYNNLTCPKRQIIYPDYGHEHPDAAIDEVFRFFFSE